jgi:hypothetical protein
VYYERDRRWLWAGDRAEEGGRMVGAEVRALGRYAVYADIAPPRVGLARTARQTRGAPHGRWSVRCSVVERGSGIDPRQSYFTVDGRRVPTEWETDRAVLRWRPLAAPSVGSHSYEVVATDHAGNVGRQTGTFVVR